MTGILLQIRKSLMMMRVVKVMVVKRMMGKVRVRRLKSS